MWVGFADDTTLFFESVEDMQAAMNILVDIFDRYRLILNEDKTETICDPDIDAESDYPKNLNGKSMDSRSKMYRNSGF